MARLFDRWFGQASALARARSAELRGELERAVVLFERGGRPDEALRVRRARALASLASLAGRAVSVTASGRRDMGAVARELESLCEFGRAAEAYAQAGDFDSQARALGRAGEVDRLDDLLEARQRRSRDALELRGANEEFAMLVASGRRREAVALALGSGDDDLRARGRSLIARRVSGPVVRAVVRGNATTFVLGGRLVLGRPGATEAGGSDGAACGWIPVTSAAVSRRHLAIDRRDDGVWVRDLGSHNGTTLLGAPLTSEIPVGDGIELRLGGEVPLIVRPAADWPGAMSVEIAGTRHVAPLGPAPLGVGGWRLERTGDGGTDGDLWVELVTDDEPPAFSGHLQLARRVALLTGDALAQARDDEPALVLLDRED